MKKRTRLLAMLLAAIMLLSLAACGGSFDDDEDFEEDATTSETGGKTEDGGNVWDNTTFMSYLAGSPGNWSPFEWEEDIEDYIGSNIRSWFWGYKVNEAQDGFDTFCNAAKEFPIDITEEYAGKEEWGIPADAKNGDGWAYRIKLRQDLCWEDGTPITANDFVESMKRLLDPEIKCYRASEFYDNTISFVNARNYYWQGEQEDTVPVEWDQVGLKADGDYDLIYILSKPCSEFYVIYSGSLPLVKDELYDSCIEQTGDIKKSRYCTSADTTMSWGPYKLSEYQEDKVIKLTKNDKWFGWNDPDFEGKDTLTYDGVTYQILKEHATAVQLFLQGKIDELYLNSDDMKQFGSSDYLHLTPDSYSTRISFNSDYETLKGFETPGVCKVLPSYEKFRKAFSRAINRKEYCSTCTASSMPCFGLFDDLYISNPENGTVYRHTPGAQQAVLDVYSDGVGDPNKISGYDLEEARQLFQEVYLEAKEKGDYHDGDIIEIKFMMFQNNEHYQKIVNYFNDKLTEALVGTGFEGCSKIELVADEAYYDRAMSGEYEAIFSSYGGALMNLPIMLQYYTEDSWITEYGFHPGTEEMTATIDGKEYTMTYSDWAVELIDGMWANAAPEVREEVMAAIERAILLQYRTIPLYYNMSGTLLSHRLTYETDEYLPQVGYGKAIMSMNDEEWAAYVAENGGKLDY